MGLILRQSAKTTIVRIVATMVGMVSMLWIYPLDHEAYGTAQFLVSCTLLLIPFVSMGLPQSVIKFFSEFGKKKGDLRTIMPTLTVVAGGLLLAFAAVWYALGDGLFALMDRAGFDQSLVEENKHWIIVLVCVVLVSQLMTNYLSSHGRVVVPSIIQELGFKLFLPGIVLAVYMHYLSYEAIAASLVGFYVVAIVGYLLYTARLGLLTTTVDWSYLRDKVTRRSVVSYGLFTSLASLGGMLAFRLDSIMITTLIDAAQNGLYFNILVMASVIDMPQSAIGKVAGPVIATAWNNGQRDQIRSIYKKSSLINQIVGSLIFLGIWVNLDSLFAISSKPEVFEGGLMIFIILGTAKLIDAVMGVNSQVLAYSPAYKYNLVFILALGVVSIFTNYLFIPEYGVMGAAIATFISLVAFNVSKLVFIYFRFRLQPFSLETLYILSLSLLVAGSLYCIPTISNDYLAMAVKSTLTVVFFVGPVYWMSWSPDFNQAIDTYVLAPLRKIR